MTSIEEILDKRFLTEQILRLVEGKSRGEIEECFRKLDSATAAKYREALYYSATLHQKWADESRRLYPNWPLDYQDRARKMRGLAAEIAIQQANQEHRSWQGAREKRKSSVGTKGGVA
jgi:hypothetical protein